MYRRIELIDDKFGKYGLCGLSFDEVIDAWVHVLRGPKRNIPQNAKFYFTESGWKNVGKNVVAACQRVGQRYRVIKVKEKSINVVWRDKFEVAAQPKKSAQQSRCTGRTNPAVSAGHTSNQS